jgi:hypothetical protein
MPYKIPKKGECAAPNCNGIKVLIARSLCNTHYQRYMKYGGFERIHPALGRPVSPGHRYCPQCKQEHPLSVFRSKSGYYCKDCEIKYYKKRSAEKKLRGECSACGEQSLPGLTQCYNCKRRVGAYVSRFESRAKRMLDSIQRRSLDQGVICTLDLEWILTRIKGKCELTGLPFDLEWKRRVFKQRFNPFSPSVDRIVFGDYSPDNCRMVLTAINIGINHWGEGIYRRIAQAYLSYRRTKKILKKQISLVENLTLPLEGQAPLDGRRKH